MILKFIEPVEDLEVTVLFAEFHENINTYKVKYGTFTIVLNLNSRSSLSNTVAACHKWLFTFKLIKMKYN